MPTRVMRSELLDHVITLNEQYACRALSGYTRDYHRARTHLALQRDPVVHAKANGASSHHRLGEPHHRYEERAACTTQLTLRSSNPTEPPEAGWANGWLPDRRDRADTKKAKCQRAAEERVPVRCRAVWLTAQARSLRER